MSGEGWSGLECPFVAGSCPSCTLSGGVVSEAPRPGEQLGEPPSEFRAPFIPGHTGRRLRERNIDMVDVDNVLRTGRIDTEGRLEDGSWRYRMETDRMVVVVAFRSRSEMVIVTAWRK